MGRKGDSKRKAKKTVPVSKANVISSSNTHSGDPSSVSNLVESKGSSVSSGNTNPSKKAKKGQNKGI